MRIRLRNPATLALIFALASSGVATAQGGRPSNGALIKVNTALDPLGTIGQPTCSLRSAILSANENRQIAGCKAQDGTSFAPRKTDLITFALGPGAPVIRPQRPLPKITESVWITGSLGEADRVVIDGSAILSFPPLIGPFDGLVVAGVSSTIEDLVIHRFSGHGILLGGLELAAGHAPPPFAPPDFEAEPELPDPYPMQPDPPPNGSGRPDPIPGLIGDHTGHVVIGCRIGTDASGTRAMPNGGAGVAVTTSGNRLGGDDPGDGNLISGNLQEGVILVGFDNQLIENGIGVDVSGAARLGNGADGVRLAGGQFGGSARLVSNTIAGNGRIGVRASIETVLLRRNRIFDNAELGVDFGLFGPAGSGWDDPLLTGVVNRVAHGKLRSAFPFDVEVELFHNTTCDPQGLGEGRRYVGTVTVPERERIFSIPIPAQFIGGVITATASTRIRSSEFSECIGVLPSPL